MSSKTYKPRRHYRPRKGSFTKKDWKELMITWWAAEHFISTPAAKTVMKHLPPEEKKDLLHRVKAVCSGKINQKTIGDKAVEDMCREWKEYGSPGQQHEYEIQSLDVWGHSRDECVQWHEEDEECDGYSINAAYRVGKIWIARNEPDSKIISSLVREGYLTGGANSKTVKIEGEPEFMEVRDRNDDRPLLNLVEL